MSRQQIVQQAEAFLRAHMGESVPLERLCRVIGVKERTLRNAFYEVRGMSPKRCLVRQRLHGARHALRGAGLKKGIVTSVATDYGFYELGRFAGAYKAVFGETPSETVRCGQQVNCLGRPGPSRAWQESYRAVSEMAEAT